MEKCKVKNLLNFNYELWWKQRIPVRRTWLVFGLPWILPVKGDNRNTAAISHSHRSRKIAFWCWLSCPVRVNATVRGSRSRKSYSVPILSSQKQMFGKFNVFQRRRRLQYVLFDMLNKYFTIQIAENTFILHRKKKSKQEYRSTLLRVKLK